MNVIRKSLTSLVGTGIVGVTGLGIGIILARLLLPEGLGQYGLVASTAGIVSVVASLGMGQASVYFINNRDFDSTVVTTGIVQFGGLLAVLLPGVLFVLLGWEALFGSLSTASKVGAGLYLGGHLLINAALEVLVAAMEIKRYVVVKVIPNLIFLLLLCFLALSSEVVLSTALLSAGAAQVVGALALLWFLRGSIELESLLDFTVVRKIVRYGLLLNLSYMLHLMMLEGGLYLVRWLADDFGEVGYYKAAVRIGAGLLLVADSVGPLLYSKYAASDIDSRRRQVEQTCRVIWAVALVTGAGLAAGAQPIVSFLLGSEFLRAASVLQILVAGMVARAVLSPMLQLFSGSGAPLKTAAVVGSGLVVMVIAMLILIPSEGSLGAAWGFTAGNIAALMTGYAVSAVRFDVAVGKCFIMRKQDIRFIMHSLKLKTPTPGS